MAGGTRGHYEANPVLRLAIRESKIGPSCPLGINRFDPAQEKNCVERTLLDNVGDEVAKSGRRLIEHINDSGGFNVLQTQLA